MNLGANMNIGIKFVFKFAFAATLTLSALLALANADIQWNWSIDHPKAASIANTGTITSTGTIINDVSSTAAIADLVGGAGYVDRVGLLSSPGDFTSDRYSFDDGPLGSVSFIDQFPGISIAPGQSFSFVLYALTPVAGLSPGTYQSLFNSPGFPGLNATPVFIDAGGVQVTVVPEPSPALLFLAGLLAVGGFARRIKQF